MIIRGKRAYYALVIVVFTGLLTYLHLAMFRERFAHVVLEELYYIPLLLGALRFGLKGALITYMFVSALYLPFFFGSWATTVGVFFDRSLHLLFTGLFAVLAGLLVEREDRYRRQAERDKHLAMIGQAAAIIAHDLKNPLITLLGFARRLREGKDDPGTVGEVIIESAQNIQAVANGVLDLSKPLRMELGAEDMRNCLTEASETCREKASEKGVGLSLVVPERPISVTVDGRHVRRALVNLIDNALEASGKGQRVQVSLAEKQGIVIISISDEGEGMDRDTMENIFLPFFTRKTGGTGLGMAIAKKVVEAHHGTIRAESRQGAGTTITITMPREAADKEA